MDMLTVPGLGRGNALQLFGTAGVVELVNGSALAPPGVVGMLSIAALGTPGVLLLLPIPSSSLCSRSCYYGLFLFLLQSVVPV